MARAVRVETPFGAARLEEGFEYLGLFVRADCNADGEVDLSDAVSGLLYLFRGGVSSACEDACDTNDDGGVDISDPVATLDFLFKGGPSPGPPYPMADVDPTVDRLGCDVSR